MCRRSVYKVCFFRKELAQFGWNFDRIYLQGADPFIRKTEDLLQIADMIYRYLPQVKSIGGHGRSEIGHSPLTYEQKAQDMLAVMKAVTNEPAILLGFSDGAYTAYKVASMYPERFQEFCTNYMKFWSQMAVGEDFLKTIQCPVLLIAGDEDDHAPMVTMVEAEQYIPNASLCIVPKAWHSAFIDNFPVTWTAMEGFLQADRSMLTGSKKVAYNIR